MYHLTLWYRLKSLTQFYKSLIIRPFSMIRFPMAKMQQHLVFKLGQIIAHRIEHLYISSVLRLAYSIECVIMTNNNFSVFCHLDICFDYVDA